MTRRFSRQFPGIYRQLAQAPTSTPCRSCVTACRPGEKLPDTCARLARTPPAHRNIHEAFGMSECSTLFLSAAPTGPRPPDTLGFAQPGRRIARSMTPARRSPRHPGHFIATPPWTIPGLMLGFNLRAYGRSRPSAIRAPWFLTATGPGNPDGAIGLSGRADDMMNAGRYRVSPIEVETRSPPIPRHREAAGRFWSLRVAPDTRRWIRRLLIPARCRWRRDDLARLCLCPVGALQHAAFFIHRPTLPGGATTSCSATPCGGDWRPPWFQT